MRVFLDTNVFLYAAGRPHPEREACVEVLRRAADGSLDASVNTEVLQEILYVLTRRGRRNEALSLARNITALVTDVLSVTSEDMVKAFHFLEEHPRVSVRDAVHASTMLRNGLDTIISVDPDFDWIPDIHRLAPAQLVRS